MRWGGSSSPPLGDYALLSVLELFVNPRWIPAQIQNCEASDIDIVLLVIDAKGEATCQHTVEPLANWVDAMKARQTFDIRQQ
jgi:hypothetical protein